MEVNNKYINIYIHVSVGAKLTVSKYFCKVQGKYRISGKTHFLDFHSYDCK